LNNIKDAENTEPSNNMGLHQGKSNCFFGKNQFSSLRKTGSASPL